MFQLLLHYQERTIRRGSLHGYYDYISPRVLSFSPQVLCGHCQNTFTDTEELAVHFGMQSLFDLLSPALTSSSQQTFWTYAYFKHLSANFHSHCFHQNLSMTTLIPPCLSTLPMPQVHITPYHFRLLQLLLYHASLHHLRCHLECSTPWPYLFLAFPNVTSSTHFQPQTNSSTIRLPYTPCMAYILSTSYTVSTLACFHRTPWVHPSFALLFILMAPTSPTKR